jgi:hypothetical protein
VRSFKAASLRPTTISIHPIKMKNSSTDRPFIGFPCSKYSFGRNGSRQSKTVLEMANVMAVNQTTKAMDAYAITTEGKFSLNLKTNTTYVIKLSYLYAK